MKLLDKYILKEFFRFFIVICITFIALYLVVDFFGKVRMFLSNNATIIQILTFFLYSIPMIISLILPPAVLLATLMAYGSLSKFSEITAMKANGISLYRISLPALIFAAIMAVALFYFTEMITPASLQKTEYMEKVVIQKQQTLGYFKQNEIWYRSNNAIYNFKIFDVKNDTLRGVTINYLNNDFSLKMRVDAKSAQWKDNNWVFSDLLTTRFDKSNYPVLEWSKEKIIDIPEKPNDFKIVQKDAEKMGFFELKKYVSKIKKEGYDVTRYLVYLQGKMAFPFVIIIMIFIGFSYFYVHALSMSLGLSGRIPAFLAAWGANITFSIAAAILFYRMRT